MDRARLMAFYDVAVDRAAEARDRYADRLREFAAAHPGLAAAARENIGELKVCRSLEELLEHVDLIDICTTTRGRMDAAEKALARGVHSMGEKPMARTWVEADRAARAFAQRPDVYFQLNDDNVFDPKYLTVRDLVQRGAIGKPQSVWIIRGSKLDATTVLKSQADALSNGGGCLMDYGSHGLAGAWSVLGTHYRLQRVEAVEISLLYPHRMLEGDRVVMSVEDNARFKALLSDGASGSWVTIFMEASWCGGHIGPRDMRKDVGGGGFFRIEGDTGIIDASGKDKIVLTGWNGGQTVVPLKQFPGETVSFDAEIETMVECVRAGRAPQFDIDFGAEIIAVCGAAYYSAIQKRAVTIEEFKDVCRSYVRAHGEGEPASVALLKDLMRPYARGGTGP
jgi:predicted dehydrogenase